MNALGTQITALYAQNMSAAQIADALGLDVRAVEYELSRTGALNEEDIPEDDFRAIRDRLIHFAKYSEDEHVAARVGMFIYEQKRGSAKMRGAPSVSLTQINQMFEQANARVNQMLYGTPASDNGGGAATTAPAESAEEDRAPHAHAEDDGERRNNAADVQPPADSAGRGLQNTKPTAPANDGHARDDAKHMAKGNANAVGGLPDPWGLC